MKAPVGPRDPLYEFGRFVADPVVGRLYYGDEEVPLTPKVFSTLLVLLETPGRCVEKDELFGRVWPGTFIEDNNLARTVSMLRKALHERESEQDYIATVQGHGYRFVGPVRQVFREELAARSPTPPPVLMRAGNGAPQPDAPDRQPVVADQGQLTPDLNPPFKSPSRSLKRLATTAASACLAVVIAIGILPGWGTTGAESPDERRLQQLTSSGRVDSGPSWSPDGRMIAYSSDRSGNFDIWVQPVDGGSASRLTSNPGRDWQPSWSPDGRYIGFRSERNGGGLFIVPATGGTERQIASFGYRPLWSPDSSKILFWDAFGVHVVGLDGGEPSRVDAMSGVIRRFRFAWHPDGRRISVYVQEDELGAGFWTFPLDEPGSRVRSDVAPAVARRLVKGGFALGNFVWSPGGDALYFEARTEQTRNILRIGVDPRTLRWIDGPERLTTGTGHETDLAVSPDGTRLAFGSHVERTTVWSLPFDPKSGRVTGEGAPLAPEIGNTDLLDVSADGRDLLYRLAGRSIHELWVRSIAGGTDHLHAVESDATIVQPRWSRDGRLVAYLRRPAGAHAMHSAVVIVDADRHEQLRLLRTSSAVEMVYDWSPAGNWFLVRCRTSTPAAAICRLSFDSSDSEFDIREVTSRAGFHLFAAKQSPDNKWISFLAMSAPRSTQTTVFVLPKDGGAWVPVTDGRHFDDKPRWAPDSRTIYFLSDRTGFWNVWGRRFDPEQGKPVGAPFQVTRFDGSAQMVPQYNGDVQMAITNSHLVLPVTEKSGSIWMLDDASR